MEVQIQEIHIDKLKSHLNDKKINETGKNTYHLRIVNKVTFLLLRKGVTSPMRTNL